MEFDLQVAAKSSRGIKTTSANYLKKEPFFDLSKIQSSLFPAQARKIFLLDSMSRAHFYKKVVEKWKAIELGK